MTNALVTWLKATSVAHLMLGVPWAWPVCETLHFIGLSLVIGFAGLLDLRLMGYMKRVPVSAVLAMRFWAGLGVAINLTTGVAFFTAAPQQYIGNMAFYYKLLFLFIALVNIAFFETSQGRRMALIGPNEETPLGTRLAGAVSMVSWFMVLYYGRMLPFIGNAF